MRNQNKPMKEQVLRDVCLAMSTVVNNLQIFLRVVVELDEVCDPPNNLGVTSMLRNFEDLNFIVEDILQHPLQLLHLYHHWQHWISNQPSHEKNMDSFISRTTVGEDSAAGS